MSTPRFLADENFRQDIVLAARRIDLRIEIARAVDVGLGAVDDGTVLEFAHVNHWLLITHDKNTMVPLAQTRITSGVGVAGLFVTPQYAPRRAVAENLILIWMASTAEEWANRIVYLPF